MPTPTTSVKNCRRSTPARSRISIGTCNAVALPRSGWSIKKFVHTARRYRTIRIQAGQDLLTAEDPIPTDLRDALSLSTRPGSVH